MSTLINLTDLLRHEIDDLYSAEEQIIDAMPDVIHNASNPALKQALADHLAVTRKQLERLETIKGLLGSDDDDSDEKKGFFTRIFGEGKHKCKGTEGLIDETRRMMGEELTPQVLDSAIIASVQKIEHYEISGYGTARAFAREMNMDKIEKLLTDTLNEEYFADNALTRLAVGRRINEEADNATAASLDGYDDDDDKPRRSAKKTGRKSAAKKAVPKKAAGKKSPAKKAAPAAAKKAPAKKSLATKRSAPKKAAPARKAAAKKAPVKKSAPKKATAKKATPSKKSAPKKGAAKKSAATTRRRR